MCSHLKGKNKSILDSSISKFSFGNECLTSDEMNRPVYKEYWKLTMYT